VGFVENLNYCSGSHVCYRIFHRSGNIACRGKDEEFSFLFSGIFVVMLAHMYSWYDVCYNLFLSVDSIIHIIYL
jgi:hypothetical protein